MILLSLFKGYSNEAFDSKIERKKCGFLMRFLKKIAQSVPPFRPRFFRFLQVALSVTAFRSQFFCANEEKTIFKKFALVVELSIIYRLFFFFSFAQGTPGGCQSCIIPNHIESCLNSRAKSQTKLKYLPSNFDGEHLVNI